MTIDIEELAAVVRLLKDAEFSEFHYTRGETQLLVRRGDLSATPPMPAVMSAPVAAQAALTMPPHVQTAAAAPVQVAAPAPLSSSAVRAESAAAAPSQTGPSGQAVPAPLLGTFYSAPKPGEAPFVRLGDRVTADTVLCIVEVMKLMNSVTAGIDGVVTATHARDGDLVEHGQPLFTIAEAG